jgi:hypothetical protein
LFWEAFRPNQVHAFACHLARLGVLTTARINALYASGTIPHQIASQHCQLAQHVLAADAAFVYASIVFVGALRRYGLEQLDSRFKNTSFGRCSLGRSPLAQRLVLLMRATARAQNAC